MVKHDLRRFQLFLQPVRSVVIIPRLGRGIITRKILFEKTTDEFLNFFSKCEFCLYENDLYYMQWWLMPLEHTFFEQAILILNERRGNSFVISGNDIDIEKIQNEILMPMAFHENKVFSSEYELFEKITPNYFYETKSIFIRPFGWFDDPDTSIAALGSPELLKKCLN